MKIYTVITLALISFLGIELKAQNETNVWYFGDGAGLDFNVGTDPGVLEDGELDSFEGCSSICNSDGDLLFYTDSKSVFRSDHQVMTNGFDLNGSDNSIQSSIIVPSPANNGLYYLFTMDSDYLLGDYDGLNYSVVDMTQWDGYGAVTDEKNIPLSDNPVYEAITAVHHANGVDVWVITQEIESHLYEAYLVTENGITTTPVQSAGLVADLDSTQWQSCIKVSPNGLKVASVYSGQTEGQLFDFDTFSGMVSNGLDLEFDFDNVQDRAPYSCEFSPSGERLYVSHLDYGPIVQYDLTSDDIPSTRTDVGINNGVSGNAPFSTLQMAPNGRIYAACFQEHFVSSISFPDNLAASCGFLDTAIIFPTKEVKFGLPQFVQSSFIEALFTNTEACKGDTMYFSAINVYDSLFWDFGDPTSGDLNFSTGPNPYHIYEEGGSYTVSLTVWAGIEESFDANIVNVPVPKLDLGLLNHPDTVCIGDKVKINATTPGALSYLWFDDSDEPSLWVYPPGVYWVTVDEGLCVSTDTIQYWAGDCAYMVYPNIITPNNDFLNDTFLPVTAVQVLKFNIIIYDRWGTEVFSNDNYTIGWDGTNKNGNDVSDGTYFYVIKYSGISNEVRDLKGTVQVTRYRPRQ